jgi:hypothetical protein
MGLLYSFALAGPGAWGAQALHWWAGLVAACGAYCLTRKLGAGSVGASWAAAFVVATPSFLLSSTWAASDLAVAAFGVVACTMALDRERGPGWNALAGVLCGAAFGSKYVAATAVILPVGLVVAAQRDFRRLAAWAAGAGVATLPWLVRNVVLTGNPLYPFLSQLFGAAEAAGTTRAAAGIAGERGETIDWVASLTLRTFDPIGAAGWIGPYWLVLLPLWFAFAIRARGERRPLLLASGVAVALAAWTQFHQLGRYLLPVLVLAGAGAGWAWERLLAEVGAPLRRAALALMTLLLIWGIQGGVNEELFTRIACTFGRSSPQALLERYVSYWPALAAVRLLPEQAKVLLVGESRAFGVPREVVLEDPFRTPYLLELAERSDSPAAMAQVLRERGITHVLYNEQEAARIAALRGQPSYFSGTQPAAADRLQQFFERCLELTAQAPPVRLYRLAGDCASTISMRSSRFGTMHRNSNGASTTS